MDENMILDIIQKSEFKKQLSDMRRQFFGVFETQQGFCLSDEENLALAMGVLKLLDFQLFYYIVPVWFEMWKKERDNK